MAANVNSSEFTHATQLFADKTAANAWRTSLTVFDASTSTEGVVKQCTHVGDLAGSVDSVAIVAGASVTEPTTIGTISATPSDAEIKAAFTALAEKINYLTYRLEQAGIMADS
jgi:hypothetical protein|tara:strand:+ start:620 stop:958 length:339 start_codon:yes stop_codon:yes gene_type:complete